MSSFEQTAQFIKPGPTDVWGLKFFPDIEPEISNDQDHPMFDPGASIEVSDCNAQAVVDVLGSLGSNLRTIVEIGVSGNNGGRSMSLKMMQGKPEGCIYAGIDIEDRSHFDDPTRNIWTFKANSHQQEEIRAWLFSLGITEIDLLFIDGWHSVNTCVNDWKYTDLLSRNGVVMLHDVNGHPGCVALYEAVDETLFSKERFCTEADYGIAVFRRL